MKAKIALSPDVPNTPSGATDGDAAACRQREKLLPLPDVGDVLFIFILQLTLFARPSLLFSDGSTGWHLVTGEHILKTMSIPRQDLMSYTFPDKQWVAYEWLFDAAIAWLASIGGMNLLAVVVSVLIGFIFVALYDRMRASGCPMGAASALVLLGIITSAIHWLVRPHVMTFLGVFLYSTMLEDFYRGKIGAKKLIASLFAYMIVWVNCHPAFLLGIAIVGLYLVITSLKWFERSEAAARREARGSALMLALTLAAVVAATLINPYGIHLYEYIVEYLKGSTVLDATNEFMSPVFKGNIHSACLELLFAALIVGLAVTKRRPSVPQLAMTLVFAHLSLSAVRNMPLFVIVSLPVLGMLFAKPESVAKPDCSTTESLPLKPADTSTFWGRLKLAFADFEAQEKRCKMHIAAIAFAVFMMPIAASGGSFFGTPVLGSDFDFENKPTATLAYLKEHDLLKYRGANFDNWGGYLRYKLGTRVFIDDRADFYGEAFYHEYKTISFAHPGWKDVLNRYKINWLLFGKNSRISAALKEDPDFELAAEDAAASLFVRKAKI